MSWYDDEVCQTGHTLEVSGFWEVSRSSGPRPTPQKKAAFSITAFAGKGDLDGLEAQCDLCPHVTHRGGIESILVLNNCESIPLLYVLNDENTQY